MHTTKLDQQGPEKLLPSLYQNQISLALAQKFSTKTDLANDDLILPCGRS